MASASRQPVPAPGEEASHAESAARTGGQLPARQPKNVSVRESFASRLWRLRDRIVASPVFQRWASSFPLTRPIAERQAATLFDLCAGFVYSQVLAAAVRMKLFERLWETPRTAEDLAAECGLPPDGMRRLLAAACSLGLIARRSHDRYGLSMLGAALHGNPGVAAMVEHHAMLYDDLRDPVALLRGEAGPTRLASYWPYAANAQAGALDGSRLEGYTALMASSQGLIADDILAAYDFSRHACLLDIGGGDGTFLLRAAGRAPSLSLMLFDLPPIAGRAAERFAEHGLSERAQAHGGDFLAAPLPSGADLITLIRILLDHDDDVVLRILKAARRAIEPGGALLIAEMLSGARGARAVSDAYFGFYLLVMGRGRPRSFEEIGALLKEAGFSGARRIATRRPLLTNLVIAHAGKRQL
jgi:demethylspheroidene O-methyltransferase